MRRVLGRIGVPRLTIFVIVSGLIVFVAIVRGPEDAGDVAAIIGTAFFLLTLIGFAPAPPDYRSIDVLLPAIADDVQEVWRDEADRRGLYDIPFVPPTIVILSGLDAGTRAHRYLSATPRNTSWSFKTYKEVIAPVVSQFDVRRCILYGEAGTGKSTLAVALTIGLLDNRTDRNRTGGSGLVPLMLSLNSWTPDKEPFQSWIDRRLESTYPSLALIDPRKNGGRAKQLANSGRFLFILDSLDELPRLVISKALHEINAFFPPDRPLFILSRRLRQRQFDMADAVQLALMQPSAVATRKYLRETARSHGRIGVFEPIAAELDSNPDSPMARVIRIPLFLRLACRAILQDRLSASRLRDLSSQTGDDAIIRAELFRTLLTDVFGSDGILGAKRAQRWLRFLASLTQRGARSFSWWRLGDGVPRTVLFVSAASVCIPAYFLALIMPVGLTRGLAIGVCTGISFGMLRGTGARKSHALLVYAVMFVAILALGVRFENVSQGVADAVEISSAVALAIAYKDGLIWAWSALRAAVVTVLIGASAAVATKAVSQIMGFSDPRRGLLALIMAGVLGVGVAVIAARLLMFSRIRMAPSRVRLTTAPRLGGWFAPMLSGVAAASLIGIGGALVGAVRYGLDYAVGLLLLFGVVVGIPVGIVAGLIRWLSSPLLAPAQITSASTLRSDRVAAIGSIVGIAMSATIAITLFAPSLRPVLRVGEAASGSDLTALHGVLLGLTMGVIVACFYTAWPTYFVAHLWLAMTRKLPWRLMTYLRELHKAGILRQEGPLYQFRNVDLQNFLARP